MSERPNLDRPNLKQAAEFIAHLRSIHFALIIVSAVALISLASINRIPLDQAIDEAEFITASKNELINMVSSTPRSALPLRERLSWVSALVDVKDMPEMEFDTLKRVTLATETSPKTELCDILIDFSVPFLTDDKGRIVATEFDQKTGGFINRATFLEASVPAPEPYSGDLSIVSNYMSLWDKLSTGRYHYIDGYMPQYIKIYKLPDHRISVRRADVLNGVVFENNEFGRPANIYDINITNPFEVVDITPDINILRKHSETKDAFDFYKEVKSFYGGDQKKNDIWEFMGRYGQQVFESPLVPPIQNMNYHGDTWLIAKCLPVAKTEVPPDDWRSPIGIALIPVSFTASKTNLLKHIRPPGYQVKSGLSLPMQFKAIAKFNPSLLDSNSDSKLKIEDYHELIQNFSQSVKSFGYQDDSVEYFGVQIPGNFVRLGAAFTLFFLITYFYIHYKHLKSNILDSDTDPSTIYPWIGLYNKAAARTMMLLSVSLLPISVCAVYYYQLLCLSVNNSIVQLILFSGTFLLSSYLGFMLLMKRL